MTDRTGIEKQLCGDLAIAQAEGGTPHHLQLLGSEQADLAGACRRVGNRGGRDQTPGSGGL